MKKGFVAVINNMVYPERPDVLRKGSDEDVTMLRQFFEIDLGFEYRPFLNKSSSDLMTTVRDLSEKDYSQYDSFFCVLSSHGSEKGIICVDEKPVAVGAITSMFTVDKCKSLWNKPKVFIIQACRGSTDDPGAVAEDSACFHPHAPFMHRLPVESDFLVAFSSPAGYTSFRHEDQGSWFIQRLVEVFKGYYEKEHLLDLLLRVNYKIARLDSTGNLKQMPSYECRLTKKCYFQKVSR